MHIHLPLVAIAVLCLCSMVRAQATSPAATQSDWIIAAYYWPDYHPDPRMEKLLGHGWTEYQMIAASKPKYPGHYQPRVPKWGPENEAESKVFAKKIDAAADHGVNCLIFDWYWYDNQPFLEAALNDGFLKAPNRDRIRFALMWANHDFQDIFPRGRPDNHGMVWPGAVDRATFDSAVDHLLERGYFKQPNYWRIDGKLYFSIYEVSTLIKGLGGVEQARAALESLRQKVRDAGLGEIHLNAILFQLPSLPSAVPGEARKTKQAAIEQLGFDSVTSYTWAHSVWPDGQYDRWAKQAMNQWPEFAAEFSVPYYPNVSIGWDNNARILGPLAAHITDSTPARFEQALRSARAYVEERDLPRILTINAWNEWPEGSYLEPDERFDVGYLDAVRNVFPPARAR